MKTDCLWPVLPLRMRFDPSGKLTEAWYECTCNEKIYCGRDIQVEYWKTK
jgi:hypothetical protein